MSEHLRWRVGRWMTWEGDDAPSEGIVYEGNEQGARWVYDSYVKEGKEVTLYYQGPPVTPPVEVIATSREQKP